MATVFIIVAVLARRLSIEDFASYIATASLVTLLGVCGMLGLNHLVCRRIASLIALDDVAGAASVAKQAALLGLLTSLLTAVAFWTIAPWLARFLACPALLQHAPVIASWIVLLSFSQIIAEAFRGIHNLFAAGILAGISGGLLVNLQFLLSIFALDYFHQLDYRTTTWAAATSFLLPTLGGLLWLVWCWPRGECHSQVPSCSALPELNQTWSARSLELLGQAIAIMLVNLIALGFDQAGTSTRRVFVFHAGEPDPAGRSLGGECLRRHGNRMGDCVRRVGVSADAIRRGAAVFGSETTSRFIPDFLSKDLPVYLAANIGRKHLPLVIFA